MFSLQLVALCSGEVVNKARVLAEIRSASATAEVRNTDVAVRVYGAAAVVTASF